MAKRAQEELPLSKPIRRMSKRRFMLIVGVLIGALLVLYLLISAGLSYNSLTSGDLILYVEPSTEHLRLEHGEQETLTYTLGVSNLPFCEATCNWSITDLATGERLRSGVEQFSAERKQDYELALEAPSRGRASKPYQFHVACTNARTQYCKAEEGTKQAAALTVVEIDYTADEQEAYASLQEKLPSWSAAQQQRANALAGIADLNDVRVQNISRQAEAEHQALTAHYEAIAKHLADDNVLQAREQLEKSPATQSLTLYSQAVEQERFAAQNYSSLYEQQGTIDALIAIDAATRQAISAALAARLEFYRLPPEQALRAFAQALSTVYETAEELAEPAIETAMQGQELLAAERLMACTLKQAQCPAPQAAPQTLTEAVDTLRSACAALRSLPLAFEEAHTAYALSLEPTRTVDETEALYNVSSIRSQDGFTEEAAQLRIAARNGEVLTTDPALRLAVPLLPSAGSLAFIQDNCNLSAQTVVLPPVVNATLAQQPSQQSRLPTLSFAEPNCCSVDACTACNVTTPYPVVFVHGHSFTDSSSPEYNMYAFVPMVLALQEKGYVYAGHVFPRDNLDEATRGELARTPSTVLFTATYYYNSYPEEGQTRFIAHKSENIETYAIRLKEAIDVVQHKTGQDKVVIVAHSMGGLVARRYLQIFGEQETAAVMLIGTPNHGITGRVSAFCPLLGGEKECEDMSAGSVFLAKLNNARDPATPFYTIAGSGCDGMFDGIVTTDSVALSFAQNTVTQGSCLSSSRLLHSLMLDPQFYPRVYEQVGEFIEAYTR